MGILARTLLFAALTGLVGLASVRILVRRGGGPTADRAGEARRRLGVALSLLGLLSALLLGWDQFSSFRDPFAPWQEDARILLGTPWGRRWLLLLAGFGASAGAFAVPRARALGWALAPVLALYPPLAGHAAAVEGLAPLTMAADWIHILASGAWLGALAVLAWVGRPGGTAPPALVRVLPAFSLQARVAVALILLTGSGAAAVHLGSAAALAGTPWGRILAGKLGLVALLLLTGLANWRGLSRDVATPEARARLIRSARLEAILGLGVLVVTAWLTGTAPPG